MSNAGLRRRKAGGFTLIELMVVMAITVVLLLIAAPVFTDFIARSRLRSAADDLTNQLALARAEALRLDRNVNVSVVGSATAWCAGGRQYTIPAGSIEGLVSAGSAAPACDCSSATDSLNCLVENKFSLVKSIDYENVEMTAGGGTAFAFDRKLGTLTNLTGATLTLRSTTRPDRYKLNIVVNPMGHARTCAPAGFLTFGGIPSC